jgi:hypothetical protein
MSRKFESANDATLHITLAQLSDHAILACQSGWVNFMARWTEDARRYDDLYPTNIT